MKTFTIQQNIFKSNRHLPISVLDCHEQNLTPEIIGDFLKLVPRTGHIGLAPQYDRKCRLSRIAMATATQVLLFTFSHRNATGSKKARLVLENIFSSTYVTVCAFQMDYVAAALHLDHGIHLAAGKHLLSVSTNKQLDGIMEVLAGELTLNKPNVINLFQNEESSNNKPETTALQAWAAYQAATMPDTYPRVIKLPIINTIVTNKKWLKVIAKTVRDMSLLIAHKPTLVKNEVKPGFSSKSGNIQVNSTRFKTRLMKTYGQQVVRVETEENGVPRSFNARTRHTNGRSATLSVAGKFSGPGATIRSITTVGRECLNPAEEMRESIMLMALQGHISIDENPFIRNIYISQRKLSWSGCPVAKTSPVFSAPSGKRSLNDSQRKAVNAILSNAAAHRIVLIQGPPGTGKTTVISSSVINMMASSDQTNTIWLVAQSNVAVKNIAEKLATDDFLGFKILVSKDFHFDWHEHLYEKIQHNLIRSDEFIIDSPVAIERLLLGSRVLLCTISMLSHRKLGTFSRLVPPQTVIVDEASQVEIGDYFPMLILFRSTLRKLVFIGDDKQLAPHGQSDIPGLESIFEKRHFQGQKIFLDTQYRMPIPIGDFISENVYNGQLKSVHSISDTNSCQFIDVKNGVEKSSNHSWQNLREVEVAIEVAKKLINRGKSFRIITPYDRQRSLLENDLKQAALPWEDKCFNIDSFQGNEDDYIIISLVRSEKMGFLKESKRINVMLSRCKKGMIICTNRRFIEGTAKTSLVGKLAKSLGEETWVDARQVLYEGFQPFV